MKKKCSKVVEEKNYEKYKAGLSKQLAGMQEENGIEDYSTRVRRNNEVGSRASRLEFLAFSGIQSVNQSTEEHPLAERDPAHSRGCSLIHAARSVGNSPAYKHAVLADLAIGLFSTELGETCVIPGLNIEVTFGF